MLLIPRFFLLRRTLLLLSLSISRLSLVCFLFLGFKPLTACKRDVVAQHLVFSKREITFSKLAIQNLGQPQLVVFPHLVIRDLSDWHPKRLGLVGLDQLTSKFICGVNRAMNAQTIGKLEVELGNGLGLQRCQPHLFLHFSHSTVIYTLAFLDFASGPINLAFTESSLLMNKQNFSF